MNKKSVFASLTLSLLMLMTACEKETAEKETSSAVDNGIADNYFNDLYAVVNTAAANSGFAGLISAAGQQRIASSDCPAVTLSAEPGTFPNTMTIDFGTGCTGYYGLERSGKIIATFSGPYKTEGTVITITTDAYHVNGTALEGTKTVTNLGLNAAGNMHYSVIVSDAVITFLSGETITWNSERDREWSEGLATGEIADDVYSITGTANGINRDDIPFTMRITTALKKEMDCNWIISGVMEISPEGLDTRVIDYGTGTCDNEALLTVGDFSITIHLPF